MSDIKIEYDEDGLPVDDFDPDPGKRAIHKKMNEEREALMKQGYTEQEIQEIRKERIRNNPIIGELYKKLEDK